MTEVRVRAQVQHTKALRLAGTAAEVESQVKALRRAGELVGGSFGWWEPDGRMVVEVTVRATPLAARRRPAMSVLLMLRRPLVAGVVAAFPTAGVTGYLTYVWWGDLIAQALATVGATLAVGLLVYAAAGLVAHRMPGHHCPGCRDH